MADSSLLHVAPVPSFFLNTLHASFKLTPTKALAPEIIVYV